MRKLLALGVLLLPLSACGPIFAVIPPNHAAQVSAQGAGVTLSALAEQWATSPSDLADRVTPIAVVVRNDGPTPIAISLADFELYDVDNDGGPALNPFVVPIAQNLTPEQQDVNRAPKLARGFGGGFRGGGFRGGGFRGSIGVRGYGYRGGYSPGRRGYYGPRVAVRPAWRGRGFWVSGGLRGWYGGGALYWGGAWLGATGGYGYSDWGGSYSAQEVIQYALPEGVLQPGGEVRGFVYFQRLTSDRTPTLRLRYKPRDANTGVLAPPIEVQLEVVRS